MMTSEVDATKSAVDSIPISNDEKRRWLLTLLSFHPEKKVTPTTNLQVALIKGSPSLLVDNDPTSVRKCLVALQKAYLYKVQAYTKEYFQNNNIKPMCQLVVQIAHQYPFTQKEILKQILASYPHQNANLESLVIY